MLPPVTLDAEDWEDRALAHRQIAAALDFPDWYGSNLDALFDCLSQQGGRAIRILNMDPGPYRDQILTVLRDAVEEGWITLRLG